MALLQSGPSHGQEDADAARARSPQVGMLAADRAVANTHEQMLPFLVSMWLHAVFVSPTVAASLGAAYVVLRAVYPLLLGSSLSMTQSKRVFIVTGPCYAIVAWLLGGSVYAVLS